MSFLVKDRCLEYTDFFSSSSKWRIVESGDRASYPVLGRARKSLFLGHIQTMLYRIDCCICICGSDTTLLDRFEALDCGTLGG